MDEPSQEAYAAVDAEVARRVKKIKGDTYSCWWHCPKCRNDRHHDTYIRHNDTISVTCDRCGYWESQLPNDRG